LKITAPATGARIEFGGIDLSSTELYRRGDAHLAWQTLRAERPVYWHATSSGAGFWAVTRYADVRRILRDHESFTSERGTALDMIGAPDPAARKMMHATDPPCHKHIRRPTEQPLSAQAVPAYAALVRSLARSTVAMAGHDVTWDAAAALSRLPVAVVTRLMGLPDADVDILLHAAYASVAPNDPHYRTGSLYQTLRWSHSTIVDYFTGRVRARQEHPGSDLLSHLATMNVAGRRLSQEEVIINCYSLLVGGVVTTAQVAIAALVALADQGGGVGSWPSTAPVSSLMEEALRWSSPTTHFLRHARRDVTLHGKLIRAGDPVTAWIASANRDEEVFYEPYRFDPGRRPNRHIAFGVGPHRCVGRQLARLILRETFDELIATVERFELAGPPVHLASNLIAGVVELPVRARLRADAGAR
jgi:cytochrome P450